MGWKFCDIIINNITIQPISNFYFNNSSNIMNPRLYLVHIFFISAASQSKLCDAFIYNVRKFVNLPYPSRSNNYLSLSRYIKNCLNNFISALLIFQVKGSVCSKSLFFLYAAIFQNGILCFFHAQLFLNKGPVYIIWLVPVFQFDWPC